MGNKKGTPGETAETCNVTLIKGSLRPMNGIPLRSIRRKVIARFANVGNIGNRALAAIRFRARTLIRNPCNLFHNEKKIVVPQRFDMQKYVVSKAENVGADNNQQKGLARPLSLRGDRHPSSL